MNDIPEEELANITEEDIANKKRYEAEESATEAKEIVRRLEYNQPESKSRWQGENMIALDNLIASQSSQSSSGREDEYGSSFKSKLEKVESGGSYTAHNKGSGAYGKYQFIPSTLKEYAEKTGQTVTEAKTPRGQDKMFEQFTKDNANRLGKMGLKPTELNLWIAHNQGLGGANSILRSKKMTPRLKKAIASNIPKGMSPTIENYLAHWSKKFNS